MCVCVCVCVTANYLTKFFFRMCSNTKMYRCICLRMCRYFCTDLSCYHDQSEYSCEYICMCDR